MTPWLAFGLCLVAVAVAAILLSRKIDARMRQDVALDEIKRQIGGIITELNQTTERNIALIEDRIGRLDEMTELAERRIGALQGLLDRDRVTQHTYSQLKPGNTAQGPPDAKTADSPPEVKEDSEPIRLKLGASDEGAGPRIALRGEFRDRVLGLHREGFSAEEIASRIGTTVGEVDLVISLDQR